MTCPTTRRLLLASALLLGGAGGAAAQNLTIAIGGSPTSLDPHFYNASPNISLTQHLFDRLVEQDAQARTRPMLAESWRTVEPTIWEFKLRSGVKWHDGRDLTADDVAFTIERVPTVRNSPGTFAGLIRAITRVEVVDPLTIRFHTARPHPLLPTELAAIQIISRHAGTGAETEQYNAGTAAVGTGPYRLVSYRSGDRTEFVRNDGYWGRAQPWARVSYRFVANDAARTAALLAGDVDVIDQVPSTDLARLRRDPRISLFEIQGLRLIYLMPNFDRTGEPLFATDNDGRPLPRNPFHDVRVRRAMSIAIDRQALADRVMEGTARPTGQWLPEGAFGYNPDVPVPAHDPEGARRLLAEAGYPQGFRIQLNGPNDRYMNDARIIQAVGQMWTRVGVRTAVEAQPWTTFVGRAGRQEYSAFLIGWGSNPDGSHPLRNILATYSRERGWGASNRGRYSNPQVDTLLEQSLSEMDEAKREGMVVDAMRIAMQDVGVIPLHIQTNIWAARRGFEHTARRDELTRAQDLRPAAR